MPRWDYRKGAGRRDTIHTGLRPLYVPLETLPTVDKSRGVDLRLDHSDLVVGADGDLLLVEPEGSLVQDLLDAFMTPYYYWGLTHQFGSRLREFIEGPAGGFYYTDLKRAVLEVFDAEPRVVANKSRVFLERSDAGVVITASFVPVETGVEERFVLELSL
jgi:hypothetical protein